MRVVAVATHVSLLALVGLFFSASCSDSSSTRRSTSGDGGGSGTSTTTSSSTTSGEGGGGGAPTCENCGDGDACNGVERCSGEQCVAGELPADGTACGSEEGTVCIAGRCVVSACGDGAVDARAEDCDDANADDFDGCKVDCKFTCTESANCDDGNLCNGSETCAADTHTCAPGKDAAAGTSCGTDLVCRSGGACVTAGCGDGIVAGTEACDDGNTTEGDGCDNDCTFSCLTAADCDDASVCTGTESCTPQHVCKSTNPLACDDGNACTENTCDPVAGCVYPLIDADGDGHAASSLGACGDDCQDGDPTVYTGAAEACDGKDNNCNGSSDELAPVWYVDCDGDGYAAQNAQSMQQCAKPPTVTDTAVCANALGTWTLTAPSGGAVDCWDKDARAKPDGAAQTTVSTGTRPTATDFDFNCDGAETPTYTTTGVPSGTDVCKSSLIIFGVTLCSGRDGWTGATAPACGQSASYSDCYYEDCTGVVGRCTVGCQRAAVTKTQSCR